MSSSERPVVLTVFLGQHEEYRTNYTFVVNVPSPTDIYELEIVALKTMAELRCLDSGYVIHRIDFHKAYKGLLIRDPSDVSA